MSALAQGPVVARHTAFEAMWASLHRALLREPEPKDALKRLNLHPIALLRGSSLCPNGHCI